jgi:hypothetical protein
VNVMDGARGQRHCVGPPLKYWRPPRSSLPRSEPSPWSSTVVPGAALAASAIAVVIKNVPQRSPCSMDGEESGIRCPDGFLVHPSPTPQLPPMVRRSPSICQPSAARNSQSISAAAPSPPMAACCFCAQPSARLVCARGLRRRFRIAASEPHPA